MNHSSKEKEGERDKEKMDFVKPDATLCGCTPSIGRNIRCSVGGRSVRWDNS